MLKGNDTTELLNLGIGRKVSYSTQGVCISYQRPYPHTPQRWYFLPLQRYVTIYPPNTLFDLFLPFCQLSSTIPLYSRDYKCYKNLTASSVWGNEQLVFFPPKKHLNYYIRPLGSCMFSPSLNVIMELFSSNWKSQLLFPASKSDGKQLLAYNCIAWNWSWLLVVFPRHKNKIV